MTDPQRTYDDALNIVLHAWIAAYLQPAGARVTPDIGSFSDQISTQAIRLRESAVLLQAALEKMRLANERLAARMAEHKTFFAKYQTPG